MIIPCSFSVVIILFALIVLNKLCQNKVACPICKDENALPDDYFEAKEAPLYFKQLVDFLKEFEEAKREKIRQAIIHKNSEIIEKHEQTLLDHDIKMEKNESEVLMHFLILFSFYFLTIRFLFCHIKLALLVRHQIS